MGVVKQSGPESLLVAGQLVEIRRSPRRRKTATAYFEGRSIVLAVPPHMSSKQIGELSDELVPRLLSRKLRLQPPQGDQALLKRAGELAELYLADQDQFQPPRSVRWVSNQHHRWGSCSVNSATIRLTDRLRAMPSWVSDYVLLHELVHLISPDHSPDFWALVHRYPDAERARGFLEGWLARASEEPGSATSNEPGSATSYDPAELSPSAPDS